MATPVESDEIGFTNSPWTFSIAGLKAAARPARAGGDQRFRGPGAGRCRISRPHELEQIGGGGGDAGRAVGVLGRRHRSRRLGAGARARWAGRHCRPRAATSRSRPATRARIAVLRRPARRGWATSPTSGCCRARACSTSPRPWRRSTGAPLRPATPEEVTEAARRGSCPACVEAVPMFSTLLGSAAGDLALTVGARGGIYRRRRRLPAARAAVRPGSVPAPLRRQGPHASLPGADPDLARAARRHRPDRRRASIGSATSSVPQPARVGDSGASRSSSMRRPGVADGLPRLQDRARRRRQPAAARPVAWQSRTSA